MQLIHDLEKQTAITNGHVALEHKSKEMHWAMQTFLNLLENSFCTAKASMDMV